MTTLAKQQRLRISNVLKLVVTDIRCTKHYVIMSKLIWKLYAQNMISEEVAQILLDKLYE